MTDTPSNWPLDYESDRRHTQHADGLPPEPSVLSPVGDDMDYRPKRKTDVDFSDAPW